MIRNLFDQLNMQIHVLYMYILMIHVHVLINDTFLVLRAYIICIYVQWNPLLRTPTSLKGTYTFLVPFWYFIMLNDPSTKDTSIKRISLLVHYRGVPLYMYVCRLNGSRFKICESEICEMIIIMIIRNYYN